MKKQDNIKKLPIALLLLAMFVLGPAAMAASISTDQEDYAPWEIVTINGSGFEPASEMTVTVEWPDGYVDEFYGTADDSGGFTLTYGKEKYDGTFTVTAEDSAGNTATTTFTDSTVDVAAVDVTAPTGSVTLERGGSGPITINMTVTGKQEGTATFKVYRDWTLSAGVFAGSNPQTFTVNPRAALDPPTTFITTGTVTVASGQAAGTFTLAVSAFDITNTNTTGAKLNAGSSSSYLVNVSVPTPSDTTPPVITPRITGTLGNNGWYTSDVEVTWTVTDDESPITSTTYTPALPHKVTADTAGTTFTCTATSAGGTSSVPVMIKRDATPPSLTWGAVTPAPNGAGWNNTPPVTISYTLDGGNVSGVASAVPESPLSFNAEGAGQTQTVNVTDNAGNRATFISPAVNIDWTPPVVTATAFPFANAAGWNNTDVTVTFSATDIGGSGVATVSPPVTVSTEGAVQVITGSATDVAGNPGSGSVPLNIDKTAPVVTIALPGTGTYLLNQPGLNATWSATDPSPASGVVPPDTGTLSIDTSSVGTKILTVAAGTVQDVAGNSSVAVTATYYVRYDFGGFLPPINPDGSSIFKLGSTVPVKFQLRDADGAFVTNAMATIMVAKISNGVVGSEVEAVSTAAATSGNCFRYSSDGNQYIFNLATKSLSVGTWQIRVILGDGTSPTVQISLKK